jgi:hypothetical protein
MSWSLSSVPAVSLKATKTPSQPRRRLTPVIALEAFVSSRTEGIFSSLYLIYDEVSHRTPVLNALQLKITEFFQIPADITVAYRPSKTNTTALQRTCKSVCSGRSAHLFLVQQSPFERSANVMKLFALQ